MRPRTKPREAAPGDEEILAYDNVPVDVAARYLDWPEQTVRLALRPSGPPCGARPLSTRSAPAGWCATSGRARPASTISPSSP